jgi:hypothetical protein
MDFGISTMVLTWVRKLFVMYSYWVSDWVRSVWSQGTRGNSGRLLLLSAALLSELLRWVCVARQSCSSSPLAFSSSSSKFSCVALQSFSARTNFYSFLWVYILVIVVQWSSITPPRLDARVLPGFCPFEWVSIFGQSVAVIAVFCESLRFSVGGNGVYQ